MTKLFAKSKIKEAHQMTITNEEKNNYKEKEFISESIYKCY
jgi:hypothetical protein